MSACSLCLLGHRGVTRARDIFSGETPPHDYSLLRSTRVVHDSFVLAYRSVIHEDVPAVAGYERGESLTSGFIVQSKNQVQSEENAGWRTSQHQSTRDLSELGRDGSASSTNDACVVTYLVQLSPKLEVPNFEGVALIHYQRSVGMI